MTLPPVAELRGIRFARRAGFALEVEELRLLPGEVVCLLGPTGAGKTTLLSLLAGSARPEAGTLVRRGESMPAWQLPLDVRRRTTMVFQRPLLLAGSVRRNVQYGPALRGNADGKAAETALDRLGLAGLADRSAASLSGGETQLVALARALAVRPELLLLDEPTASLDPARVALVERTIRTVVAETKATVVWATHNLFQAHRVADRVALLLDGRIVESAATADFFERPSDPRTADFVQGRFIY